MKKAPQKLSGDSAVYLQIQGISSDNIKFLRGTEPFYNICPITVASCLNEQIGKTAKNKDDGESNMFAGDFAAIEKKGFSAYVRDLEKEKIEKIRKDILERMGLSEADLSKLPPEQRAMIEDLIAQEIKDRLAASSMKNNDDSDNKGQSGNKAMIGIRPDLAFLSMMGDQGRNDSFSVTQKDENGQ